MIRNLALSQDNIIELKQEKEKEKMEQKYKIKWLYSDFKKKDGYKKSIMLSQKYNLYRQNYCGCIYSKKNIINSLQEQ